MWITVQDKLINLEHVSTVKRNAKTVVLSFGYFGVNKSQDLMSGVIDNSTLLSETIKCEDESAAQAIYNAIAEQLKPFKIP
jgi:hypothetical protein